MTSPSHPCEQDARRLDRDRFLTAQFAPVQRRGDLYALYAFNQDMARAPDSTEQPMLARMRVQWWKDALDAIFDGEAPKHPTAQALSETVRTRQLPRVLVDELVTARLDDADRPQPETLVVLEAYLDSTAGCLAELAARVLVRDLDDDARTAVRASGVAYGLVGVARATPFLAARRQCLLPVDLCAAGGLDREALFAGRRPPEARAVIQPLLSRAHGLAVQARAQRSAVPKAARSALLPLTFADGHLKRLKKAGFDPHDAAVMRPSGPGTLMRAMMRSALGWY